MKVTGLFGFMMDVKPFSVRCVSELLLERKDWDHDLPTEFVARAVSHDKEEGNVSTDFLGVKVKGKKGMREHKLYYTRLYFVCREGSNDQEAGCQKTLSFDYHGYKEVNICFINNTKWQARALLEFRFVIREKTVSSIRERSLQLLEVVLQNLDSAAEYISSGLSGYEEYQLSKTSLMLWTCQLLCALFTVIILLGLGVWQVLALRRFFRNKKLV